MSDRANLNALLGMILPFPDVYARVKGTTIAERILRNREALDRSQLVVRCGVHQKALRRRGAPIAFVITSRMSGSRGHRASEHYTAVCAREEMDAYLSCRGKA